MNRWSRACVPWVMTLLGVALSCETEQRDFNQAQAGSGQSEAGDGVGGADEQGGNAGMAGDLSDSAGLGGAPSPGGSSGGGMGGGSAASDAGGTGGAGCDVCECDVGQTRSCLEDGALGRCAAGKQTCGPAGRWTECSIRPRENDTCAPSNDDNCNGIVNEGCVCNMGSTRSCSQGGYVGPCADGRQTCVGQTTWGDCSVAPATEDSCSEGDNSNCQGPPNEGCRCIEGKTRACGPCGRGTQTCTDGKTGRYGACAGDTSPRTYYRDSDSDGHGSPTDTTTSCDGVPAGYVEGPADDCYDENDDAFPGQARFFTAHRGDQSWDYDCDNVEEPKFTTESPVQISTCFGTCSQGNCSNGPPGRLPSTPPCGSFSELIVVCGAFCGGPSSSAPCARTTRQAQECR